MYLRAAHADATTAMLRQLIHDHPLGIFTTAISSPSFPLIQSSHIPFLIDFDPTSDTDKGVLRGHMARANPQCKALIEALNGANGTLEQEVMVLFTSPVQHYVTPKFYVETKPTTGKVVPTWNYAAAQIYGKARIFNDTKNAETSAFLRKQISDLSRYAEEEVMGFDGKEGKRGPWKVEDAPETYTDLLMKSIVGIEIVVDRLEGKFKMSQELKEGDRAGVIEGFKGMGGEVELKVAELVKQRQDLKEARAASA